MNRCTKPVWSAVKEASALLQEFGINHVLVGTAALAAHGYDVTPGDVDFLCEMVPPIGASLSGYSRSKVMVFRGVKANFIFADELRLPFMPGALDVDGVPVARPEAVVRLKKFADRPKDHEFFQAHPEMLLLCEIP